MKSLLNESIAHLENIQRDILDNSAIFVLTELSKIALCICSK